MTRNDLHDYEDRTRDNFETVYQVFHAVEYGFGGDNSRWVAVTEETEDVIEGRLFGPTHGLPGERITIQKKHVAGWQEDRGSYTDIPENLDTFAENHPMRAYNFGVINVDEYSEVAEQMTRDIASSDE